MTSSRADTLTRLCAALVSSRRGPRRDGKGVGVGGVWTTKNKSILSYGGVYTNKALFLPLDTLWRGGVGAGAGTMKAVWVEVEGDRRSVDLGHGSANRGCQHT